MTRTRISRDAGPKAFEARLMKPACLCSPGTGVYKMGMMMSLLFKRADNGVDYNTLSKRSYFKYCSYHVVSPDWSCCPNPTILKDAQAGGAADRHSARCR